MILSFNSRTLHNHSRIYKRWCMTMNRITVNQQINRKFNED
jgi:hypothetical protein